MAEAITAPAKAADTPKKRRKTLNIFRVAPKTTVTINSPTVILKAHETQNSAPDRVTRRAYTAPQRGRRQHPEPPGGDTGDTRGDDEKYVVDDEIFQKELVGVDDVQAITSGHHDYKPNAAKKRTKKASRTAGGENFKKIQYLIL